MVASLSEEPLQQMVHVVSTALAQLEEQTPATYAEAMASPQRPKWKEALAKEMASIDEMEVWDLVPRLSVPASQIVLKCKWVFRIKTDEHGAITVYKARLTPKGFMQRDGINVYETFAATGKYKSMRASACPSRLRATTSWARWMCPWRSSSRCWRRRCTWNCRRDSAKGRSTSCAS